jgi:transketolase
MSARWEAFGWDVQELDGHDVELLAGTMENLDTGDKPHVLLAQTTFGKGVSYMESVLAWHYMPMSDEQYEQARIELGAPVRSAPLPPRVTLEGDR